LICYQKARENALVEPIIKAGWLATGLWPKDITKPLMSCLLLENSNQATQVTTQVIIREPGLDLNQNSSLVTWRTPRRARELREQVEALPQLGETDLPTRRRLFRKITKGFDEKDFTLADAKLRIEQLEAMVKQLEPRKRRAVRTSPNSKFADIQAIIQAQIEAGDREIEEEDSDSSKESTSTSDCIIVQ
jgi:hypothetical protein